MIIIYDQGGLSTLTTRDGYPDSVMDNINDIFLMSEMILFPENWTFYIMLFKILFSIPANIFLADADEPNIFFH